MQFNNTVLEGLHPILPPQVLSSEELESRLSPLYDRLGFSYGRLELMTGIRERRFWPEPQKPSHIATEAAQGLIQKLGLGPQDYDLLIYAGVCRDQLEPATASSVHAQLGLSPSTQLFDLSNACLGFMNAMTLAGSWIHSGHIRRALIVAGEDGLPLVEHTIQTLLKNPQLDRNQIKPYFANFTIGSGAVAASLSHQSCHRSDRPLRLTHATWHTDTQGGSELCQGGTLPCGEGLQMQTDSEKMLERGVHLAAQTWEKFLDLTQWNRDTAEVVISHQVGKQHRKRLYEGLRLDLEKDFSTFEHLGNVGSASVPITLAQALEKEAIIPGDLVALLGIGSGLNCMMMALQA